jgi:hypothetical protein
MRNCFCDITGPARPVLHAYRFSFARPTLRKFLRRRRYDGCWKTACSMSEWRDEINRKALARLDKAHRRFFRRLY